MHVACLKPQALLRHNEAEDSNPGTFEQPGSYVFQASSRDELQLNLEREYLQGFQSTRSSAALFSAVTDCGAHASGASAGAVHGAEPRPQPAVPTKLPISIQL